MAGLKRSRAVSSSSGAVSTHQPSPSSSTNKKRKSKKKKGVTLTGTSNLVRIPISSTVHKGRGCPLCSAPVNNLKNHARLMHLPWFITPEVCCWHCQVNEGSLGFLKQLHWTLVTTSCSDRGRFNDQNLYHWLELSFGLIQSIAGYFGMSTPTELLEMVKLRRWHPTLTNYHVSEIHGELFSLLDRFMGCSPSPPSYTVNPPNSVSVLVHWEILLNLLVHLPQEVGSEVRNSVSRTTGNRLESNIADGHLHLTRMLDRFRVRQIDELKPDEENIKVSVVINNCVFPNCRRRYREAVSDSRVWFTFGQHPRLTDYHFDEVSLDRLIQHSRCVGVGECGLDFNGEHPPSVSAQEELLHKHLRLAIKHEKVVVLHLRPGNGFSLERVYNDCLLILQSVLSRDHPVYLHCFTGHRQIFQSWVKSFPNTLFGISTKVFSSSDLQDAVGAMPLHCLALETDSPYLTLYRKPISPWYVREIARFTGQLKNLPESAILAVNERNIVRLYNIIL